jgi:hypothetical protein
MLPNHATTFDGTMLAVRVAAAAAANPDDRRAAMVATGQQLCDDIVTVTVTVSISRDPIRI